MSKMSSDELVKFFEEVGFKVFLFEQDNEQCSELEMWTAGGVDMIIGLLPFKKVEFKKYVNEFDVDEQIDLHRQSKEYKDNFTISESLKDFTDFHNKLKEIVKVL